ncbi:MAG: PilZ domain-containing protein [Candidatus Omnitrophota bacterium]|nr:PilZ domain-containing protein [Candidatus Omnitrophota bacterium]
MTHSKSNSPGSERRRFRRVRVNLVVVYREDEPLDVRIRAGGVEHASTMVDICEEGISILTDINVSVATVLWIRFTLAEPKSKGLDFYGTAEIKGKVLYSMLIPTGHYRLGIHFFDLKDKERRLIANFVDIVDKKLSIDGETNMRE